MNGTPVEVCRTAGVMLTEGGSNRSNSQQPTEGRQTLDVPACSTVLHTVCKACRTSLKERRSAGNHN